MTELDTAGRGEEWPQLLGVRLAPPPGQARQLRPFGCGRLDCNRHVVRGWVGRQWGQPFVLTCLFVRRTVPLFGTLQVGAPSDKLQVIFGQRKKKLLDQAFAWPVNGTEPVDTV
jgi:hypothetical protein